MALPYHIRRKPQRKALGTTGGSDRVGNNTRGGLLMSFPLWEGDGNRLSDWASGAHQAYIADLADMNWSLGDIGIGIQGLSTDAVATLHDTNNSLRLQQPLPITIEVVFELLTASTNFNVIFANDSNGPAYSGVAVGTNNSRAITITLGDNSGTTINDRKTFASTTTCDLGEIYHAILSVDSFSQARIFLNGVAETVAAAGNASTLGYSTTGPAVIGGGNRPNTEGFQGRIYLINYYNRSMFAVEAEWRARDPFRMFRPMQGEVSVEGSGQAPAFTKPLMSRMLWFQN